MKIIYVEDLDDNLILQLDMVVEGDPVVHAYIAGVE
jgi:hypothetical protein